MSYLNPAALALLSLAIPVVIFYFMKLKRKELRVTASFLWNRVMQEARVDSFFQKLKVNILLILQLLIIAFLVAALVRPYFKSMGTLSEETIFIIDNSASMGAREGKRIRLDEAREKIGRILDEARWDSRFMMIEVSDSARILCGFTGDRAKIRQILSIVQVRDTGTDLKPGLLLAVSLQKSSPQAGIILVGDRVPKEDEINLEQVANFQYLPVGTSTENLAITSFDVSRPGRSGPADLFVRVHNFSHRARGTLLEILQGDTLTEARQIEMEPGQSRSFVFKVPAGFAGVVTARISDPDGLPADNEASAVIRRMDRVKVLLVSPKNLFVEKALSLLPDATLEQSTPEAAASMPLDKYDVVVWNGCTVPVISGGGHLFLGCRFKDPDLKGTGEMSTPRVTTWDAAHPVLRFVNMAQVGIASAPAIKAPPQARVIVDSDQGPLAFLVEKPRLREVFVLFDVMNSDWPLSPSFPIFIANSIDYLAQRSGLPPIDNNRSGQTIALDFVGPGTPVRIQPPGQMMDYVPRKFTGEPLVMLNRVGIYRVKAGDDTLQITSNLLNPDESRIAPDPPIRHQDGGPAGSRRVPLVREIWWELALVALLILILEWYIFNCRRV